MKILYLNYVEVLKKETLLTAGIATVLSSDCYPLSLLVEKETQKRVSETTLKRVFGFAASCYNPSAYTMNTLAEFCGYKSWEDFLNHKEKEDLEGQVNQRWATIIENAHKISRFNIESNKLKSGISYNFTIYREELEEIITDFSESSNTACIFMAPAGGGKTIAITQWIDRHINKEKAVGEKDIFLLINTTTLLTTSVFNYHANHWLCAILGIDKPEMLEDFFETYRESAPGKFYIVIDDSSSSYINSRQYESLFTQMIDLVNHFSHLKWLKIVISMRCSIFRKHKYLIERNDPILSQWQISNGLLGGFSNNELQELSNKLIGTSQDKTPWLQNKLSFIDLPINFQIYYQLKGNDICPDRINRADKFMIVGTFLNQYILKGANLYEKRKLLNNLVRYAYYNEETLCIPEGKGVSLTNQFSNAYKELANSGLLHMHHEDRGMREFMELRFQSSLFGSYFLAQRILVKNRGVFNAKLIELVNNTHYPNAIKTELLYWLIDFAIESAHLDFLDHLAMANFTKFNELKLILFVSNSLENFKNHAPNRSTLLKQLEKQMPQLHFIDYALRYFSITPDYIQVLETFLTYNLSSRHKILVHAALGLQAFLKLDTKGIDYHLCRMNKIDQKAYSSFFLNPYIQLKALYSFFKTGESSKVALQEITTFNLNPIERSEKILDQLSHSLALLVSQLSENKLKTLRFLQASQRLRASQSICLSADYMDFIQLIKAREWLKKENINKAKSIQYTPPTTVNHNIAIQVAYAIYKIELAYVKGENIQQSVNDILQETQKTDFIFSEVLVRLFFAKTLRCSELPNIELIEEHESIARQMVNESGFRVESFIGWLTVPVKHPSLMNGELNIEID